MAKVMNVEVIAPARAQSMAMSTATAVQAMPEQKVVLAAEAKVRAGAVAQVAPSLQLPLELAERAADDMGKQVLLVSQG